MSRVRFTMSSMDISIDLILPVLGSTQLLTEMSIRNLAESKGRPVRKADNPNAIYEPTV
jgi:hypothetical protein